MKVAAQLMASAVLSVVFFGLVLFGPPVRSRARGAPPLVTNGPGAHGWSTSAHHASY